jgi:hypothetical protein
MPLSTSGLVSAGKVPAIPGAIYKLRSGLLSPDQLKEGKSIMRLSTPKILNVLSVIAIAGTILLYVIVRAGYNQNKTAADVIGKSATSGIIAAQHLKVDLARMHAAFAKEVASDAHDGPQASEFAEARKSVSASLVESAKNIHFGAAETVPIKRIQYVLPTYQSAVTDALKAQTDGDKAQLATKIGEAQRLMKEELLPLADQLDEANSTALNNAYNEQVRANQHINNTVLAVGLILAVFLAGVQLFFYRQFRRVFNPAIAAAMLLTAGFTTYVGYQFFTADHHLSQAKEDVFQRLHIMWRAEARMQEAHADLLFAEVPGQSAAFGPETKQVESKILSLPNGLSASDFASQAIGTQMSDDPTGYLAILARDRGSVDDRQALSGAIASFGDFRQYGEQNPGQSEKAFATMVEQLSSAKSANDVAFRKHANGAFSALSSMEVLALGIAIAVAFLSYLGVRSRMREYEV